MQSLLLHMAPSRPRSFRPSWPGWGAITWNCNVAFASQHKCACVRAHRSCRCIWAHRGDAAAALRVRAGGQSHATAKWVSLHSVSACVCAQSLLLYMAPIAATLLLPFTVVLEGNVVRHVTVLAAEEPCAPRMLLCLPPSVACFLACGDLLLLYIVDPSSLQCCAKLCYFCWHGSSSAGISCSQ